MNLIDEKLKSLRKEHCVGLMTHVVVGYPSLKETVLIVKTMVEAGADFVELQIPFSDPLADGPTIMKACERALGRGTRVKDAFVVAEKLRGVPAPLLFMAYYNTVFKYGVRKFCCDAAQAGISGLIVPDLPLEEEMREHLTRYATQKGLHVIRVIAPASTKERLRKNAPAASGFVYCSARQGITGARKKLTSELSAYLKNARRILAAPLAVGFGISIPGHVKQVSRHADIVVVGSAIIDVVNLSTKGLLIKNISRFVKSLRQAAG